MPELRFGLAGLVTSQRKDIETWNKKNDTRDSKR
jgi:hypothetical protein